MFRIEWKRHGRSEPILGWRKFVTEEEANTQASLLRTLFPVDEFQVVYEAPMPHLEMGKNPNWLLKKAKQEANGIVLTRMAEGRREVARKKDTNTRQPKGPYFEAQYMCPKCGPFNVIHANRTNRNKQCAWCASPIRFVKYSHYKEE